MSERKELLQELELQEQELQFTSFSNDMALALGLALLQETKNRGKAVTIDITRNGQQLFHFAMEGTSVDNDEWVRRKTNVVNRFGHSSFYMGTFLKDKGQSIEEKYLISSHSYAPHGGSFPLIIKGVGVVGTVTVSGLPQQEDHEVVVKTLRQLLATSQR